MSIIEKHIRSLILENGYITLDVFLSIIIPYYYQNQTSLGPSGDFITAPELSQVFGEIIGIYFADYWLRSAKKQKFNIVEFGPGRGYLIADFLRATKNIQGFHDAISKIILFENSTKLISEQKRVLHQYIDQCIWINNIEELHYEILSHRSFFIANEFFDALPIKQFQNINGILYENCLVINYEDKLQISPLIKYHEAILSIPNNGIIERITTASIYTDIIKPSLLNNGGSALIIDYGYLDQPFMSSLQAVYKHNKVNILDHIGEADVTSLVDFRYLANLFDHKGIIMNIMTQKEFLESYGIYQRAEMLIKYGADKSHLEKAVNVLTADNKMGKLFKVLLINA